LFHAALESCPIPSVKKKVQLLMDRLIFCDRHHKTFECFAEAAAKTRLEGHAAQAFFCFRRLWLFSESPFGFA
jgi:hypothetical protein